MKTVMATRFAPDGKVSRHEMHFREWMPRYDLIKMVVEPLLDGGQIEHVAVLHADKRADLFVDEEGALKGLRRNDKATRVYRNNTLSRFPEVDPESLPAIYGPAVLFDEVVWS